MTELSQAAIDAVARRNFTRMTVFGAEWDTSSELHATYREMAEGDLLAASEVIDCPAYGEAFDPGALEWSHADSCACGGTGKLRVLR